MNILVIANFILWLSVFTWFMPNAIDKQASNDDTVVIEHKLEIGEQMR